MFNVFKFSKACFLKLKTVPFKDLTLVIHVGKMIFSIKVFVTLLDYLKIPQFTISGDLHV
jgi:hypothetical protein